MSKLIDADMLSPDRDYYENSPNCGYDAVSCQQIDNAPTVKAVPIDSLKQLRNEAMNMNSIAIIQRLDKLITESEEK